MVREDEIKLIAYRIWEEEGCVEGQDCEHWLRAEAIWELNQKAPVAESKQVAEPKLKVAGKKRKSKKT